MNRPPSPVDRRSFLGATAASAAAATGLLGRSSAVAAPAAAPGMRLGLVTYNWGKDWDLPTIIRNCEATGFEGVELRSGHKHGVEIDIDARRRREVAARFKNSDVELVGLGSACEYHSPDPAVLQKNIEETKAFITLCKDLGGGGVKVRPNALLEDVPAEKTLEQIGLALREVAAFGADRGVEIRLEVHGRGGSALLPNIAQMMAVADHPNAVVCWNCNGSDLDGEGLEHNFNLVKEKIGTVHIHDLRNDAYPWKPFFKLLNRSGFAGWTLLEDGNVPENVVSAMRQNRPIWDRLAAL
ncbi:sugar phosphate isomerase/epimerase family protein [Alienimonas californiensis]|uniref:Xylose isomerase-like TIM barrel n=1 Tax=Alienimonas californiensis TaxID=2527989 RepID=A0A517P7I9_9PLAN|nr:TIM barrel protein [Alienimonas californiensis]QDT15332.1 Xylose isomerase-like TIM barrel [Alienimonas californiensis]